MDITGLRPRQFRLLLWPNSTPLLLNIWGRSKRGLRSHPPARFTGDSEAQQLIDHIEFNDRPSDDLAFDTTDIMRLERTACEGARAVAADLRQLLPAGISAATVGLLKEHCSFAHQAVLLFPATLDAAMRHLAQHGFDPLPPARSVLVRRRLADRYQLDPDHCDVWLTRCRPPRNGSEAGRAMPRTLEVFLFPRSAPALRQSIIDDERACGFEDHIALAVRRPHADLLVQITTALQNDAHLLLEAGAHIPHEGPHGSMALYFVRQSDPGSGGGLQRWELHCAGDFSRLLVALLADAAAKAARHIYDSHARTVRKVTQSLCEPSPNKHAPNKHAVA